MYDVIIIGAGISGMTAALYSLRANLKVLLLEKNMYGGQIINSPYVENYPAVPDTDGATISKRLFDQLNKFNYDYKNEEVIEIVDKNTVKTNKNTYTTKTIIIATGLSQRKLGLNNEDKLIGRGISYCATCDGAFFKHRDVAVIGGGNVALEDALYLSGVCDSVYMIVRRDVFRGDPTLVDRVKETNNIEIIYNSQVKELIGDEYLTGVVLDNGDKLSINGLFVAIGYEPNNKFVANLIELDDYGFIKSNDTETNIDNIFASGDTRTKDIRQLVTAASDGAIAATKAINYININK